MAHALPDPMRHSVAWLGHCGLLPFLFLALAGVVDRHHTRLWNDALTAYGAVILTLVGALRRGFAMTLRDLSASQRTRCFVWSVVPALGHERSRLCGERVSRPGCGTPGLCGSTFGVFLPKDTSPSVRGYCRILWKSRPHA